MPGGIDINREYSQDFQDAVKSMLKDLTDGKLDWKYLDEQWKEQLVVMSLQKAKDIVAKEYTDLWKKTTQNWDKYDKVKTLNDAISFNDKNAIQKSLDDFKNVWAEKHETKSAKTINNTENEEDKLSDREKALKFHNPYIFGADKLGKSPEEIKEILTNELANNSEYSNKVANGIFYKFYNDTNGINKQWENNDYIKFADTFLKQNQDYLNMLWKNLQSTNTDRTKVQVNTIKQFMEETLINYVDRQYNNYLQKKNQLKKSE